MTLVVAVITAIMVPVMKIYIDNQHLIIERESDRMYVHAADYKDNNLAIWKKLSETDGKIDVLNVQQASTLQTLLDVKDGLKEISQRQMGK